MTDINIDELIKATPKKDRARLKYRLAKYITFSEESK